MSLRHEDDRRRDARSDQRALLTAASLLLVSFSIGSAVQTAFVFRPERLPLAELVRPMLLDARLLANLATVGAVLLACTLIRLALRRGLVNAALVLGLSAGAGLFRFGLQTILGIYDGWDTRIAVVEVLSGVLVVLLSLAFAVIHVRMRARMREHERQEAHRQLQAAAAVAAEEVRVRREIAEGLHGTLQGKLVVSQATIAEIVERGRAQGWEASAVNRLDGVQRELETIRERDVRELSHLIYPAGVEIGLQHAVRLLVKRVPPHIAVMLEIDSDVDEQLDAALADPIGGRIAVIRGVEEGISNALRHGAASALHIAVRVVDGHGIRRLRSTVDDDGAGAPPSPRWSGLARMAERVRLHDGTVELSGSPEGGTRLTVELPLR